MDLNGVICDELVKLTARRSGTHAASLAGSMTVAERNSLRILLSSKAGVTALLHELFRLRQEKCDPYLEAASLKEKK